MSTDKPLSGDLKGCKEIKLRKAGLRTIFKQSTKGIELIEIIIIEKERGKSYLKKPQKE